MLGVHTGKCSEDRIVNKNKTLAPLIASFRKATSTRGKIGQNLLQILRLRCETTRLVIIDLILSCLVKGRLVPPAERGYEQFESDL